MDRDDYSDVTHEKAHLPPANPPTIDPDAEPLSAAELANDNGGSDYPGLVAANDRGRAGREDITPGETPDEIVPDEGDVIEPTSPDEIDIEQGDIDEPAAAPPETLLPPD